MILLAVLTLGSCQTIPTSTPAKVPEFGIAAPERPTLLEIPSDTSGAISTLTINLSLLASHIVRMEAYYAIKEAYYKTMLDILN
jgi:hypothetical protein